MKLIKEVGALIGLIAVLVIFVGYNNDSYATRESLVASNKSIEQNNATIKKQGLSIMNVGSVLCGIVIDLKLPTARKECNSIITNQQ